MELTHTGCQLLQRRQGGNLEQIIPELVFNFLLLAAARLPRKGANVQAAFYLPKCIGFKLFRFEIPGSKRQFHFFVISGRICCNLFEGRNKTPCVIQSCLAAFSAQLVSDPSHEDWGQVLKEPGPSHLSYNWSSLTIPAELTWSRCSIMFIYWQNRLLNSVLQRSNWCLKLMFLPAWFLLTSCDVRLFATLKAASLKKKIERGQQMWKTNIVQ